MRLGWGPGPGDRMLAPGLPDALFCDGAHLGWVTRDGVYALMEEVVHLVCAAHPIAVSFSPGAWIIVHRVEDGVGIVRFDPRNPTPEVWNFQVRSISTGSSWAVLDHGSERSVIDLDQDKPIRIPVGAADARPQAWADGPGLIWVQQGVVYRMTPDLQVRVAGTVPSQPEAWRAGPGGAAIFYVKEEVWGMAPGSTPRLLQDLAWEGLRFAPSGQRLLGATEDGVAERCLRTGQTLWAKPGQLHPVGFGPDPIVLHENTGRVRDSSGRVFASGFNPSAAARNGHLLYGPGGTSWNLEEGVRSWPHAPLQAEHLAIVGDKLVAISDDLQLFTLDGEPCGRFPLPLDAETEGSPINVTVSEEGHLVVELEEDRFELSLAGQRAPLAADVPPAPEPPSCIRLSAPDEPPCLTLLDEAQEPLRAWPLGMDDGVQVAGRVWCWSEDGMLCALEPLTS